VCVCVCVCVRVCACIHVCEYVQGDTLVCIDGVRVQSLDLPLVNAVSFMCCSVLQCVIACCIVWQCVAV